MGSPLTTVTMNRGDIAAAFPELICAAEGPVIDTSCACLMRLAQAVHAQGYKVVLTGEGADEALAGYVWFKTQKIRERVRWSARRQPRCCCASLLARSAAGGPSAARAGIGGVRPAQQDMYEFIGQAGAVLYSQDDVDSGSAITTLTTISTSLQRPDAAAGIR